jgi:hypothetical protein
MTKISADSLEDFINNAQRRYGAGELGETKADPAYKYGGFKDGKVIKLEFTCPVTTDYAEPGSGKPDPDNRKAIADMADLVEAHEKEHKAGYEKAFKDWDPKGTAADLMKQTFKTRGDAEKAMKKALDDLKDTLHDACLALHKKGGTFDVKYENDGSITITERPAGPSGCR